MILAGKLAFPRFMDKNAKSLVKKLLVADLTKRYGCVKGGAQDIKSHKWFTGFDFEALLARQIPAPIVPQVCLSTEPPSNGLPEQRGIFPAVLNRSKFSPSGFLLGVKYKLPILHCERRGEACPPPSP